MKAIIVMISSAFPFLVGCKAITKSTDSEFSNTPEKIARNLIRQSDEIVSMKRIDYDSLVKSNVDPELLVKISNLKNRIMIAKRESQGSGISTFEIDTIPKDLILLKRQILDQQTILRLDCYDGKATVVVQEKVNGDGRSEGYLGEVLILFEMTSDSSLLKDVIFRRYKGIPEWRLSGYLSDQEKIIENLRRRLE